MPEAATPAGGAEAAARPQQAQQVSADPQRVPTIQERLKASLFPEPQADPERAAPKLETKPLAKAEPEKAEPAAEAAEDPAAEAPASEDPAGDDTPADIRSLTELAEGLGWDLDKVLDLEASTKIGGKDGKVRLRDLVKSHQLEGHLNSGLMRLAEERKGFEGETARKVGEIQARVTQLNQAVGLAQKILDGEYADVNWPELQRTDPAQFQAKYGAYKMRLDGIQQLNSVVGQETERVKAEQGTAQKAYLDEQAKLLESKLPEWADKAKRDKDVTEMVSTLSDSYGISEQEVRSCVDHRQILMARDAMRWQKLQKAKPAIMNKVKAAPKLLKPGTTQSRADQNAGAMKGEQARLAQSGKVADATPLLKRLLFN